MNIVILAGGLSTERDVSLSTGSMVCKALRESGHRALLLDVFLGIEDTGERLGALFTGCEAPSEILAVCSGSRPRAWTNEIPAPVSQQTDRRFGVLPIPRPTRSPGRSSS